MIYLQHTFDFNMKKEEISGKIAELESEKDSLRSELQSFVKKYQLFD